jgi:hypothetical protein
VVNISIFTGWQQPGFRWTGALAGTITTLNSLDTNDQAVDTAMRVHNVLAEKGWLLLGSEKNDEGTAVNHVFVKVGTSGVRTVGFEAAGDIAQGWMVRVSSRHSSYDELCASKRGSGL